MIKTRIIHRCLEWRSTLSRKGKLSKIKRRSMNRMSERKKNDKRRKRKKRMMLLGNMKNMRENMKRMRENLTSIQAFLRLNSRCPASESF